MGSRSESEDQLTFDPHYSPPNTVDFGTHEVLGSLAAADEFVDQILEGGVTRDDGKKEGRRKRIISLVDDTDDSDVCSKGKSMIRGGIRKSPTKSQKNKVAPTQSQKKKEKIAEDISELGDELDEEEVDEDEFGEEEREERQRSDVWADFKVVQKPNGMLKAACNHCKNEYEWQSHSHGTSGCVLNYWISLKCPGGLEQPAAYRSVLMHSFAVQPARRSVRDCALMWGGIGLAF
ncbi:hypothetical protein F2Q69_00028587 [Brassica cretica]|uniref:BED-type domain-containing protein n=2 Tax=Brassica TaxID=3705 RepID=A0A8S9S9Q8_BRACR|nr:hypothetical protein F2Q69_00028587 [Brassica cretica]